MLLINREWHYIAENNINSPKIILIKQFKPIIDRKRVIIRQHVHHFTSWIVNNESGPLGKDQMRIIIALHPQHKSSETQIQVGIEAGGDVWATTTLQL